MARGRDLTFSLLSDVSKFTTDEPARDLDKLGDAAHDAGADLEDLERARERLNLEDMGDDATRSAKEIDRAFDRISKASKGTEKRIDDDTRDIKSSLGEVGDEAGGTAREMAASFSGGADDVVGAFQELAANAGTAFGPIGIAAGVAAGVGVGLITAKAEELRQVTEDLVQDMIDAGGTLTEEAVNARITTMATTDPSGFIKFNDAAKEAGISIRDVTRARAGDMEALERVTAALDEMDQAQRDAAKEAGNQVAQRSRQSEALAGLRAEFGLTTEAMAIAEQAVSTATEASADDVETAGKRSRADWDSTRKALADPVVATTELKTAHLQREAELARFRLQLFYDRNPVTIPVRQGQRPIRDVP